MLETDPTDTVRHVQPIGIGGVVAHSPLPHHRTCGSAYGGSVRLSPGGPEVRAVFRHKGFATLQVAVSASPSSEPAKLSRGWLAGAMPPVSPTFYCSRLRFGPSSLA